MNERARALSVATPNKWARELIATHSGSYVLLPATLSNGQVGTCARAPAGQPNARRRQNRAAQENGRNGGSANSNT